MTILKDFSKMVGEKDSYKNFSEEVDILSEANSGDNYSLYTVKNKNGVTFQLVPGLKGIKNKGFMGYINGDHGRPALIGIMSAANNTTSAVVGPDGGGGTGWSTVLTDVIASYTWDIQLVATNVAGNGTKTKSSYITSL